MKVSFPTYGSSFFIREAFQSKKQRKLGIWHLGGGGRSKIKKVPSFSWEKFKMGGGGGVFGNQKSPKFQRVSKTEK